jgi:dTDP-4-dehydrorhamnose reductase
MCVRAGERAGHELVALDLPELDITDEQAVGRVLRAHRPEAAINCAAWTDVDGAESNREQATRSTPTAPATRARGGRRRRPLLHVSTDYVFDGDAPRDAAGSPAPLPGVRSDGPRSVYGETQARGRARGARGLAAHTVVRSGWLFGVDGRNFVATMLALAGEREAPCRS